MAASGQLPGFNVIFKSPLERLSCHAYVLGGSPNLDLKFPCQSGFAAHISLLQLL